MKHTKFDIFEFIADPFGITKLKGKILAQEQIIKELSENIVVRVEASEGDILLELYEKKFKIDRQIKEILDKYDKQ